MRDRVKLGPEHRKQAHRTGPNLRKAAQVDDRTETQKYAMFLLKLASTVHQRDCDFLRELTRQRWPLSPEQQTWLSGIERYNRELVRLWKQRKKDPAV